MTFTDLTSIAPLESPQASSGSYNDNWSTDDFSLSSLLCCSLRLSSFLDLSETTQTTQSNPPSQCASVAQTIEKTTQEILAQIALLPPEICRIITAYAVDHLPPQEPKLLHIRLQSNESDFSLPVIPNETVRQLKIRIHNSRNPSIKVEALLLMGSILQPETRLIARYQMKPGDILYVRSGIKE